MDLSLFAVCLVMALAFANGTNDVSKAIATLVGSGVTNYRTAIAWGTAWTVVGAILSGLVATAMVRTFSIGLIQPGAVLSPELAVSVLVGAMAWVLLASRFGLPVSTTHALVGAIVGAGLAALGSCGLIWSSISAKIALPLLLSPFLALLLSVLIQRFDLVIDQRQDCAAFTSKSLSGSASVRSDSPGSPCGRDPLGRLLPLLGADLSRADHCGCSWNNPYAVPDNRLRATSGRRAGSV